MKKTVLVTGTAGFIFSNFIRNVHENPKYRFVGIDAVLAPYNRKNLFEHPNYKFYLGDIADVNFINNIFSIEKPDFVINGAAESFVDDSIRSAIPFIHSNILGAQVMIDAAVDHGVEKFIQISTDEVYGQLTTRGSHLSWTERDVPAPRNPYSASKYAAEIVLHAASETHGLKYNITRSCNNYGPRQPPRNLVPKIITSLLTKMEIPLHGDGRNIREWLFVDDHCRAIMKVLEEGRANEIYNIGSGVEYSNAEMIENISQALNIGPAKIQHIPDRKGHDFRYSVRCDKLKDLGWKPGVDFTEGMRRTTQWYVDNYSEYSQL